MHASAKEAVRLQINAKPHVMHASAKEAVSRWCQPLKSHWKETLNFLESPEATTCTECLPVLKKKTRTCILIYHN